MLDWLIVVQREPIPVRSASGSWFLGSHRYDYADREGETELRRLS